MGVYYGPSEVPKTAEEGGGGVVVDIEEGINEILLVDVKQVGDEKGASVGRVGLQINQELLNFTKSLLVGLRDLTVQLAANFRPIMEKVENDKFARFALAVLVGLTADSPSAPDE